MLCLMIFYSKFTGYGIKDWITLGKYSIICIRDFGIYIVLDGKCNINIIIVQHYNLRNRIHSYCDYMSPNEYEELYHKLQL